MKAVNPHVLSVNGGSSSIKFALFEAGDSLRRVLEGRIERIGLPNASLTVKRADNSQRISRSVKAPDYTAAVSVLMNWTGERIERGALAAVGHRVVHGGPKYWKPQRMTSKVIETLRQLGPFDPEHLPGEILLVEAFRERFPKCPQIACFDTAFHHDMPRVARLLPIPRRYDAKGIRRYGFHGLSCEYLMEELGLVAGAKAAKGRVILAHLGNGASITAVGGGRSVDTSMSFTPTAGLPMSTRSGDLDPGLGWYLSKSEKMTPRQFHEMINHESGLLGVSEVSSDMRELLLRERKDIRAAEAVELFCYQAKKWICAMAGVLGGLDTLIFSGGIGENAPTVRDRICSGLHFLGVKLNARQNAAGANVISAHGGKVVIRVVRTDEERIIAKTACRVLSLGRKGPCEYE